VHSAFAGALGLSVALFALAPARAHAQTGAAAEKAAAEKQLAQGEADLAAAGSACVTMCKALQSMMNAADRICALAKDGPPDDQKKCAEARTKVADALARVRAACPDCNPGPPLAPTSEPAKPPVKQPSANESEEAKAPTALPPEPGTAAVLATERRPSRRVTLTLDPMRLFAPAYMIQLRFEKAVSSRVSFAFAGGYGSLKTQDATGPSRTTASMLAIELRGYLVGQTDGFGLFVSAEVSYREASLFANDHLADRFFPLGISAGPLVGVKIVTVFGLTLESRIGASVMLDDRRHGPDPKSVIVPNYGIGLGVTF